MDDLQLTLIWMYRMYKTIHECSIKKLMKWASVWDTDSPISLFNNSALALRPNIYIYNRPKILLSVQKRSSSKQNQIVIRSTLSGISLVLSFNITPEMFSVYLNLNDPPNLSTFDRSLNPTQTQPTDFQESFVDCRRVTPYQVSSWLKHMLDDGGECG